ncbi:MAG TPA: anti-sigma regulatory factor [Candidatus Obscuribacterales bacterium]
MISQTEQLSVLQETDLVSIRNKVRLHAQQAELGLVDETKLITAASELTRNMLIYAGGGGVAIEQLDRADVKGVRIAFEDKGPGIADIGLAMTDGYSSMHSLGLGLPGARRLVDEFEISSKPGEGTRVVITKWKR